MKLWTKILTLLMTLSLLLMTLAACNGDSDKDTGDTSEAPSADATTPAEESEAPDEPSSNGEAYTIGIIQYVEHAALDAAREGFVDALKDNGYSENVTFDIQNAQADTSNLATISQRFVNNKADLVLAIATPAAQSVAGVTADIPILGTAITDYEVAKLVDSNDAPGANVTGTSDMNPIAEQIALLMELVPDAETIGIVYASNEDNSVLQAAIAKEAAEALGLKVIESTVTSSNDVQQVTDSVASKVDALYIPTDNIYASSMPIVREVCAQYGVPTICGESGMVESGGFATMGISYYDLGYQTGLMAVQILNGEAEPSTMPIQFAQNFEFSINGEVAEELGIQIPDKYADAVLGGTA